MMKRTVVAGKVFLRGLGIGVSKKVVVGALGVAVTLGRFLDLEPLGEQEGGLEEDENLVRISRDDQRSGLLGKSSSSALVKVPGRANRGLQRIVDGFLNEVEELVVVIWQDVGWDQVNGQLYSGWRLGKRKPEVIPDGKGLVEAAGESIEVWGVGFCRGAGFSASKGAGTSVIDLGYEAFGEEAVGIGEGGGSNVGKGSRYGLCEGVSDGFCSSSQEAPRSLRVAGR